MWWISGIENRKFKNIHFMCHSNVSGLCLAHKSISTPNVERTLHRRIWNTLFWLTKAITAVEMLVFVLVNRTKSKKTETRRSHLKLTHLNFGFDFGWIVGVHVSCRFHVDNSADDTTSWNYYINWHFARLLRYHRHIHALWNSSLFYVSRLLFFTRKMYRCHVANRKCAFECQNKNTKINNLPQCCRQQ